MQIGRARRNELPPPRKGRVGVGVMLKKAAKGAPLSGWRRLQASVQAIGRASPPRPPHPNPPPPRGRESASGVACGGGSERAPSPSEGEGIWGGRSGLEDVDRAGAGVRADPA